jgi:hypothetical protein
MTVRAAARAAILEWLESDRSTPEPRPPEGLHYLALGEWFLGRDEAHLQFAEEERIWLLIEDFATWLFKLSPVLALIVVLFFWTNPWARAIGGTAGLIYLWKMK